MNIIRPKGNVAITLIVAMLLIGALGTGIYRLTVNSTYTELISNNDNQAYHLAQAGIRYAVDKIIQTNPNYPSTDFLLPDNKHKFNITVVNNVITSIGIVNEGTFSETKRQIVYSVAASWTSGDPEAPEPPLPTPLSPVIEPENDSQAFIPSEGGTTAPSAIEVSTDGTVTMGGGVTESYGSLWYQGSSSVSNCNAGICSFNLGLNTYFDFTFSNEDYSAGSTAYADGFTFAIMSALSADNPDGNTRDRTGGAPGQGELMGYAGPGTTTDELGLKPPKMAIEFDTFPNGSGDVCSAGSRSDPNAGSTYSFRNHAALMFWGARTISGTCGSASKSSFDDNRHGAGGGTDPVNCTAGDTGYYQYSGTGRGYSCKSSSNTCNWMEDGYTYSCRMEIIRPSSAPYNYQIKAWVLRRDLAGFTDLQTSRFQDVMVPYTDTTAQITKTVTLSEDDHKKFLKIFFGFTEATGASTQQITLANFRTFFPQGICSYSISPVSTAYAAAGGSGNTAVTTTSTCPWMAYPVPASPNNWITISSDTESGTGNGIVNYTVAANTAPARTGYINIAGQTLTVTQANGCSYSISPASTTPGSGASTGTVTVTASNAACPWTAVSDSVWLTVTSGSSGTGSGIVGYSVAANTGPERTGTITIAGQIFTLTQASGCTYSLSSYSRTFSAAADSSNTVNVTTASTCPWTAVSNDFWITINSGGSGTGSGTVNYGVAANTGLERTGTMTIAGRTFTVTQRNGCTYTFGSCPATFPVTGGTDSISVTTATDCTWTSSDNSNWISTLPTSSSSTGSVTVTVDAYTGRPRTSPRTGRVTISGTMGTTTSINCTISESRE